MSETLKIKEIERKIIELRGKKVIVDIDVAKLYGIETKRVNEAVKNNLEKFPEDYMFEISKNELNILRSKNSTTNFSKTRVLPKVFYGKRIIYACNYSKK